MYERIRAWFAPVLFDNEEKTRVSLVLTRFSWVAILIVSILILVQFSAWGPNLPATGILGLVILLLLFSQWIVRSGHVQTAGFILIAGLWLLMTMLANVADGLYDVSVISYIIVILLASLLLDWRFVVLIGVVSIMTLWYFAAQHQAGLRTMQLDEPLYYARDLTAVFILTASLAYFVASGWSRTLKASRIELQERLRVEEKLQTQARYLAALHETTLGMLNHLELDPVLDSILIHASELLDTPHVGLDMVVEDRSALKQVKGFGAFAGMDDFITPQNTGLIGRVWATGKTIVTQDYQSWDGKLPEAAAVGFHAVVGTPIKSGEKVIGTLLASHLDKDRRFSPEQVQLVERFASLAAIAIENARLYENAQQEIVERRIAEEELRATEERFRKVFEVSPIAICITTLEEGRLLEGNKTYWKMTGYDPQTSIGKTAAELEMWDSMELREQFVERIKVEKSISNVDYRFQTVNFEPRVAAVYYELIEIKGELCVLSMFYDLSDQRRVEKALREAEARTRAMLTALPDMIFEVSKDGVYLDFIPSSEFPPLLPAERFLGQNVADTMPEAIAAQALFAINRSIETGQIHAFEYGLPPGEAVQFFEARVAPLDDQSALIMVRDISQRKWVETEREKLIQELEEKNAELERFTYTVSHDLKSPLITIRGFLGFLEKDVMEGDSSRWRSDIKRISDATDKMNTLLRDLLELSRIGRLINKSENIPFVEIVNDALDLVQGRLQSAGAHVSIQQDLPVVHGDRQRLLEVLQNLLDNAAKFVGRQPDPRIEVGCAGMEDKMHIFFVRDNGIGIPIEHHDRIFGLFNKLDASTEGTGIGLALVKRIVEFHGGSIWVQSEAGAGATFHFTLPAGL